MRLVAAVVAASIWTQAWGDQEAGPPIDLHRALDRSVLSGQPAGEGFSWWAIDDISSAVLKPDGWTTLAKREEISGWTFAMAPAPVASDGGEPATRFTMQLFWHPGGRRGAAAAREVFAALVNGIASDSDKTILRISSTPGALQEVMTIRLRYRHAPEGLQPTLVHQVFISDEHHGLVYVATFQAREDDWERAWKIGEVVLQRILIGFKRPEPGNQQQSDRANRGVEADPGRPRFDAFR